MKIDSPYYNLIIGIIVMCLITGTLLGLEAISFFGIITTGGVLVIPIAYALVGLLSEVYGHKVAQQALYITIFCVALTVPIYFIALHLQYPVISSSKFLLVYIHSTYATVVAFLASGYIISKFVIWSRRHFNSLLIRLFIAPVLAQSITVPTYYILIVIPAGIPDWHLLLGGRLLLGIIFQALLCIPLYFLVLVARNQGIERDNTIT